MFIANSNTENKNIYNKNISKYENSTTSNDNNRNKNFDYDNNYNSNNGNLIKITIIIKVINMFYRGISIERKNKMKKPDLEKTLVR